MSEGKSFEEEKEERNRVIIRTSGVGIGANVLLAGFKAAVGLASNSIAITLDAVNNLSDALSSVITIIGAKLAGKKPDKKHPLGHGRIEYLSAMIVAALVLYAGITAATESVKKIIHPEAASYGALALIILAVAVAVKLLLGSYVKRQGKRVDSGSLIASGQDAFFDSVLSASVLLSAIIYLLSGISLEAYVGVIIAFFIMKSGIDMLCDTLDDILGHRSDPKTIKAIKATICEEPEVYGAYDLILNSYGPETYIGSVHIEVDDTLNAEHIDCLERRITDTVSRKHHVLLTGIGIYAHNTHDNAAKKMEDKFREIVMNHDGALQMHGFYVDERTKEIHCDVIIDYAKENRNQIFADIRKDLQAVYPEYKLRLVMDIDV